MSKPTADWERVGDRFYRKRQLYTSIFDPELELDNYEVVGAPYSGAVAIYRHEGIISTLRGSASSNTTIDIHNHAGSLVLQLSWTKGSIKGLGWSEEEQLIVVGKDGTVYLYTDLQDDFTPFSLGSEAEEFGVRSCAFWNTGFVALLENNTLTAVSRYDEPRPQTLSSIPPGEVSGLAVIPPEHTSSLSVEVLLGLNKSIFVVDAAECRDIGLDQGPYNHISVSPNGEFVALYTRSRKVMVMSSDFQNQFTDYESKVSTTPKSMHWCGNNAVVLVWEDEIHLVGPNGAATKFMYDSFVHVVPDVDGVRTITSDSCEFIQKVAEESEAVFRFGSTSPGAVLLDAAEQLELKSPKADDDIQLIKGDLDEAVNLCVKAAGQEYNVQWQKQLLKAASFGKSVLDLYNSDDFVDMTETLRVLNAVRHFEIGMPLSYDQYLRLTPGGVIKRLINRQEYLLALKICQYLHLPEDRVYVHWARRKVRSSQSDEAATCAEIVKRLKGKHGISFEEIARAACDDGRGKMATDLLNYETRAAKQVPLLLEMGEQTNALDKATQSGDTDLMLRVLLEMKRKLPLASFFRAINGRPAATAVVETSAIDQDQELLKDMYYQDDRRVDSCNLLVSEALSVDELAPTLEKLKMAAKILRDDKEHVKQVSAIDDSQKLLRQQQVIEKDIEDRLVGLSVNETIYKLIEIGQHKRAQKVQADFQVSEKTFWWIRLRALVTRRDWNAISDISKERKSPIGWEPFFNDVLGAGNPRIASLFISKCTSLAVPVRIEMWLKCGMVSKAGEEAMKAKDRNALEQLRTKADGNAALEIDRMIAQLRKGR